jgi:hypothetical protein
MDVEEPISEDPKTDKTDYVDELFSEDPKTEKLDYVDNPSHSCKEETDPSSIMRTIMGSSPRGVPRIKPGTHYHVCGEVLDKEDFNTLRPRN